MERGYKAVEGVVMSDFKTEHDLPFEVADWILTDFKRFRIGTCDGLWRATDESYDILAVSNSNLGNGHFNDVIQWFAYSCQRDKKVLRILEVWSKALKSHLINKRGFADIGSNTVELIFD